MDLGYDLPMNILGIVGSARKGQQTERLVRAVLDHVADAIPGTTSDVLHTVDLSVSPCRVQCSSFCTTHPYQCSLSDDAGEVLDQIAGADAVVIGIPRYFRGPPAGFHTLAERLTSMSFFYQSQGAGDAPSPVAGTPCALIGVAEYSNPHHLLEYLVGFATLLGMYPVRLERFPYLGVGCHGDAERDEIFTPLERAKELATALIEAVDRGR